jgi:hypothetical protein
MSKKTEVGWFGSRQWRFETEGFDIALDGG